MVLAIRYFILLFVILISIPTVIIAQGVIVAGADIPNVKHIDSALGGTHLVWKQDNSIVLWDIKKGKVADKIELRDELLDCLVSPNGKHIVTLNNVSGRNNRNYHVATLRDLENHKSLGQINFSPLHKTIDIPDSEKLATSLENLKPFRIKTGGKFESYRIKTDDDLSTYKIRGFNPSTKTVFTKLIHWNIDKNEIQDFSFLHTVIEYSKHPEIIISPDAKYAAVIYETVIHIIDLATYEIISKINLGRYFSYVFKFSPSSKYFHIFSGNAVVWDIKNNREKKKIYLGDYYANYKISNDDQWIAAEERSLRKMKSKYMEGKIFVWNIENGQLHYKESIEDRDVSDICFCLSGTRLAAVGDNGITLKNITNPYIEKKAPLKKSEKNKKRKGKRFFKFLRK